jgi:aminoglycoside 6'-N-acetyltransferase I
MLHFKLATLDDFDVWHRFRSVLYSDLDPIYSETEIRRTIEDPALASFLVFLNEEPGPIGMIELSLRNIVDGCSSTPVAYIEGLYLIEKYQGQGLGKEMMAFIKKWAREQGCTELAVDTELEKERAQKFYLREGFEETYRVVQFRMEVIDMANFKNLPYLMPC